MPAKGSTKKAGKGTPGSGGKKGTEKAQEKKQKEKEKASDRGILREDSPGRGERINEDLGTYIQLKAKYLVKMTDIEDKTVPVEQTPKKAKRSVKGKGKEAAVAAEQQPSTEHPSRALATWVKTEMVILPNNSHFTGGNSSSSSSSSSGQSSSRSRSSSSSSGSSSSSSSSSGDSGGTGAGGDDEGSDGGEGEGDDVDTTSIINDMSSTMGLIRPVSTQSLNELKKAFEENGNEFDAAHPVCHLFLVFVSVSIFLRRFTRRVPVGKRTCFVSCISMYSFMCVRAVQTQQSCMHTPFYRLWLCRTSRTTIWLLRSSAQTSLRSGVDCLTPTTCSPGRSSCWSWMGHTADSSPSN